MDSAVDQDEQKQSRTLFASQGLAMSLKSSLSSTQINRKFSQNIRQ